LFLVVLAISSYCKVGERVLLNFQITQHARDEALLQSLKEYLGCGNYYPIASRDAGEFRVNVTADIINKIIPFFDKYPIEGVKALDYLDFKRAAKIIQMKGHLTNEGLEEIRKIRLGMNTGRSN
jgi:hypothetical protein